MILLSLALAEPVASFDLEEDDGGLSPSSGDLHWEWGTPTTGPGAAHAGSRVWATRLDEPYLNDAAGSLALPALDLDGLSQPALVFWHWTEIREGDAGWLETDEGVLVQPAYGYPSAEGFTGETGGWEQVYLDLGGLDDLSELRLVFSSDASVQGAGWYLDDLEVHDGDVAPPRISLLSVPSDTEDLEGPYVVEVSASDDQLLEGLALHWETETEAAVAELVPFGDRYAGGIPGQDPDTTVSFYVEATDGTNTSQTETGSFRVRLPPPEGLSGPEGRVVDVEVGLSWSAPDSSHALEGYRIYRGDELVGETTAEGAVVAVEGDGEDLFSVSGLFDVGEGDRCEPLAIEVSRPRVTGLAPASAWQGDVLRLEVEGETLLLVQGEVEASLGEGVAVDAIEVLDVDHAELLVTVAEDAPVGLRDLALTTGGIPIDAPEIFEVLDGEGRPAVTGVAPDALRQGDQETLAITLSEPPASEALVVDLGEGVLVEAVRVEGAELSVDVVVDPLAPLGLRPVVVDDGLRLVSGAEFRVRDALVAEPSCAAGVGPLGGWLLGLVLLVLRRR